ncbi:MAG TPA: sensor histidine kinase [Rhizomicrobium sp.]|nr:sensor histidine kinase [Rhizomicrobium sp.]
MPIQKIAGLRQLAWLGVLTACALLAVLLGFGVSTLPQHPRAAPPLKAGQLDLGQWHFDRDGSVPLEGDWLYFDQSWGPKQQASYAQVPGPWPAFDARDGDTRHDGFGTYVLRLKLPPTPAGDHFALDTGQILSAYNVLIDGKVIASPGTPGATKATERGFSYSTLADLPDGARDVTLEIRMSNHLMPHGAIFVAPTVGLRSALEAGRRSTEMLSLVIVGALLFTACYHIAFMGVTRAGYANFWFGTTAALFAARMFFFEPLASATVPLIGQDWVWRLDFAVSIMIEPMVCWFVVYSFPRHLSRTFACIFTAACGVLALASLIESPAVGQHALDTFEILGIAALPYLAQAVVRSAFEREQGGKLAFLGMLIMIISFLHDILLDNNLATGPNFLPFGCVAFFLCFSGALTQRSHHAFLRNEQLVDERTRELQEKIVELEEARAAAVSASVAKSRFLANMSHELRTPLNAILGFAEIVRDQMFGKSATDRYAEYAGSIHTSGSHLLGLINDILDLSKIEAGKLELEERRVDLGEEARGAMQFVEPQAGKKNILLAFDMDDPVFVLADARAIRQILINLLSNAVKFTPSGGVVSLAIKRTEDLAVAISVSDTGIGIRPEDMQRVFESFGQGRHDVRARSENGTGLGLPIVKGLVEAMDGRIEVESALNSGTTMTILLPSHRTLDAAPTPDDPTILLRSVSRAFAHT